MQERGVAGAIQSSATNGCRREERNRSIKKEKQSQRFGSHHSSTSLQIFDVSGHCPVVCLRWPFVFEVALVEL